MTAENTTPIEEPALCLQEEERPGRTATGTTRTIDHLAMTVAIEVEVEAEVGEMIGRHTMEDRPAER